MLRRTFLNGLLIEVGANAAFALEAIAADGPEVILFRALQLGQPA
jgi:hypothetical protein